MQHTTAKRGPSFEGVEDENTVICSDVSLLESYDGMHKIISISLLTGTGGIFGIQARYAIHGKPDLSISGHLHMGRDALIENKREIFTVEAEDEYITELYGMKTEEGISKLGFRTNKGREAAFGEDRGDTFITCAGDGSHFATVEVGMGGALKYIHFFNHEIPAVKDSKPEESTETSLSVGRKASTHQAFDDVHNLPNFIGMRFAETEHLSDASEVGHMQLRHKVHEITLKFNTQQIFSLQAKYIDLRDGSIVPGTTFCGNETEKKKKLKTKTFTLNEDEVLTEVFGMKDENGIIALGFKTSKDRTFESVGGSKGEEFNIQASEGSHYATFQAGVSNDMINNLELIILPIPFDMYKEKHSPVEAMSPSLRRKIFGSPTKARPETDASNTNASVVSLS